MVARHRVSQSSIACHRRTVTVSQDNASAILKVVVPRELNKSSHSIVLRLLYYFT